MNVSPGPAPNSVRGSSSCPSCGQAAGPTASCGFCGGALVPPEPVRVTGERRHLTVLFCDLADSTSLAEQLDPEDLSELMVGYQEMAQAVVNRFGGTVAQFLGDGVLAYFGSPRANEDDADRAVMTGLAILDSLVEYRQRAQRLGAQTLEARVGIHTGPLVVGSMGNVDRADTSLFGSSINIAARLEDFASSGSVVASETTIRLLRGRYSLADCGSPELKGIQRSIRVWEVLGAVESVEARRTLSDGAVVGRSTEIGALRDAVQSAAAGGCRVVLIKGEPGVGKSTLVHSLFDALSGHPHRWLEFQCSELASSSPLEPVIVGIRRLVGIHRYDSTPAQVAKLESALDVLGEQAKDVMPYVADLLRVEAGTDELLAGVSPELRRHRVLDGLIDWAIALAGESLLVLVAEDLHWADPTTLELLGRLSDRSTRVPVALIVTSRESLPEFWKTPECTEIAIPRLGPSESRQLVSRLAAGLDLSAGSVAVLADRGGGVPLFLEELVRSVAEGSDPSGALPETLQSVLLASLDGLGEAKSTAQAAAVLGREFSVGILAAVLDMGTPELDEVIERLLAKGILSSSLSTEGRRVAFRHALIQGAAYSSLLRRDRRQLHCKVSDVLVSRFPLEAESSPALLAHHCLAGGKALDAARWFSAAGRKAVEGAAFDEGVSHYEAGIAAIREAEPDPQREKVLLTLLILCGNAMMGSRGPGGSETLSHWELAMTVAEQIGDIEELTSAMNGAATYWFDRGQIDRTIELADSILAIAEDSGSRVAAVRGNCTLGMAYLMRGEVERSLHHSDMGIRLEEEDDYFTITYGVGHDEGVLARSMASWAHWWLGRPDLSLATATDAERRARGLPSSLTQAMAGFAVALSHFLRGEPELATDVALANVAFCEEVETPFWLSLALMILGCQRAILGDGAGLDDLDRGFEVLLALGNESASTIGLAILAESQRALGFCDTAVLTADAGLATAREAEQSFYVPELQRIKGMAIAGLGDRSGGAALLRESIATARTMGAASFRLRSSIDLVRLFADPAPRSEPLAILAESLGAMGDGACTADQTTARELLAISGRAPSRPSAIQ